MGKKRQLEICEIEQHSQSSLSHGSLQRTESRGASQPTQPHGSSQTIHLPRASQPHHLSGTSQPSNPHSSSRPIQSHCSSQPHEVEGDLDVQANEQRGSRRCNGSFDQASPHAHKRSSHASHDIECSNGGML